jgi:hypothetical protein
VIGPITGITVTILTVGTIVVPVGVAAVGIIDEGRNERPIVRRSIEGG